MADLVGRVQGVWARYGIGRQPLTGPRTRRQSHALGAMTPNCDICGKCIFIAFWVLGQQSNVVQSYFCSLGSLERPNMSA